MSLRIRITGRAADEIDRADAWWRENRLAAPDAIREDLQRSFALLALQPGIGQKVMNARLSGVRRIHLDRVHHHLYYREQGDQIVVLRFWPSQRLAQPRV